MKRFALAALVLMTTVSAVSAQSFPWPPSQYPSDGSFSGPLIVSQDDQGK